MTTYRIMTINGKTREYEAGNIEYQDNGVALKTIGPLFSETVAFVPYMNLDSVEVIE